MKYKKHWEVINMGKIYKVTNIINNQIYIGQTRQPIYRRWCDHCYAAETAGHKDYTCPLHNAIRKYGRDNFTVEEIEECPNEILNEREIYWIQYYDSYNNGYNASLGGDGHQKYDYSKIVKYFQEHGNSLVDTCKYFHIYDQVVYVALQNAGIDYKNCKNTNIKATHNKLILLIEENLVFQKITDINKYLNKRNAHGNVRRCLNGITEKAYGYHWKEIEDGDLADLGYTFFTPETISI